MRKFPARFFVLLAAFATGCLLPSVFQAAENRIYTKVPWAIGFWMEGTVTNVVAVDEHVQFQLTGWFRMSQYPWGGTSQQVIKVNCTNGISATVSEVSPTGYFFAMTTDWRGGSLRKKGDLLKILKTAEEQSTVVKFELMSPKMDFGTNHSFTLLGAEVLRVTDANLR